MAHGTDLEKLSCLRLNALGRVNDHDCGVGRHQCAVGVLGEVLVSGCIQKVDTAAVVFELQDTAGDRDSSLFFDFHPVGNRVPGGRLALDAARQVDGSAVEQELLCQGRLTCVGVRYDGKCAAARHFLFDRCHKFLS